MLLPLLAQIQQAAPTLPPAVAERALAAVSCADRPAKHLLIADMSQPSSSRRIWILDLTGPVPHLLEQSFVAHGAGSDPTRSGLPQRFGNAVDSNQTSLGLALVSEPYEMVKHGKSYRLDGLTPGYDDNMRLRGVVLHPADYVSVTGKVGRSNGCPALNPQIFSKLDSEHALAGSLLWIDGGASSPIAHCAAHLAPSPWPFKLSPTWASPSNPTCNPETAS